MIDHTGKWIKPEKLAELLLELPPGSRAYPNSMGNLAIYDEDDEYLGWVDIMRQSTILFSEVDEEQ